MLSVGVDACTGVAAAAVIASTLAGNCVAAAGSCGRSIGVGRVCVTLVQWQVPEFVVVTFDCSVQEQLLLLVAGCPVLQTETEPYCEAVLLRTWGTFGICVEQSGWA